MHLVLKPFHGKIYQKNGIFSSYDKNIFYGIDKYLKKRGLNIVTADVTTPREADYYIFCDVPYPWEVKYWILLLKHLKKSILVCFESPIINPFSHLRFIQKLFKQVYSWEDSQNLPTNVIKFYIPQTNRDMNISPVKFTDKQFLVMINSFKSSHPFLNFLSRYKTDLYQERLRAIGFFESNLNNEFSLYGKGWPSGTYSSYRGYVKNKIRTLRMFKYSLCFENNPAPGYISEKIFDCFKAKCVPIYLGAPNIRDYIPESCFIDLRNFSNYQELLAFLKSISEANYERYLRSADKFLSNPKTIQTWFDPGFISKITKLKQI
ncbi:MAG: Fucosyltransferase [Candidatus Woesebacteria bacterium GW2011_GWB1_38_5b]|uniref:Fucosyltransferase n=1 Tax=Candidatus Woesebacteria bacterium GW2011_GWB1_38_5b TaxID=1618569 RepID=A0A0G0MQF6_9BACT|nr:MAG: Fucosyltransferase [Candidatus Woesebacteria bacterium GW2011_GWB1_38_5b]